MPNNLLRRILILFTSFYSFPALAKQITIKDALSEINPKYSFTVEIQDKLSELSEIKKTKAPLKCSESDHQKVQNLIQSMKSYDTLSFSGVGKEKKIHLEKNGERKTFELSPRSRYYILKPTLTSSEYFQNQYFQLFTHEGPEFNAVVWRRFEKTPLTTTLPHFSYLEELKIIQFQTDFMISFPSKEKSNYCHLFSDMKILNVREQVRPSILNESLQTTSFDHNHNRELATLFNEIYENLFNTRSDSKQQWLRLWKLIDQTEKQRNQRNQRMNQRLWSQRLWSFMVQEELAFLEVQEELENLTGLCEYISVNNFVPNLGQRLLRNSINKAEADETLAVLAFSHQVCGHTLNNQFLSLDFVGAINSLISHLLEHRSTLYENPYLLEPSNRFSPKVIEIHNAGMIPYLSGSDLIDLWIPFLEQDPHRYADQVRDKNLLENLFFFSITPAPSDSYSAGLQAVSRRIARLLEIFPELQERYFNFQDPDWNKSIGDIIREKPSEQNFDTEEYHPFYNLRVKFEGSNIGNALLNSDSFSEQLEMLQTLETSPR